LRFRCRLIARRGIKISGETKIAAGLAAGTYRGSESSSGPGIEAFDAVLM